MSERIETVVPAIYMICVLMGWFGPNGTILGNIKLTIWHYAAIEDFQAFLHTISIFLFVDFMSFVANGILLWSTVKINIFKTLQMLQRDFWLVMAIFECALFVEVTLSISNVNWAMHTIFLIRLQIFGQLHPGSGHDLTFGFLGFADTWINGEYFLNNTICG